MRVVGRMLVGVITVCALASPAIAATISGTVKGPDGAPFMGAFVIADNSRTHMSVSVLSDEQGKYRIPDLPAATYSVRIRAVGFTTDPKPGMQLTDTQNASADFALSKGVVRWTDLNTWQGRQLLPKT